MSSNPSGRSWYRLSSIVRPTPHSSRDQSPPRRAIQQPPSQPTSPSLSPPSPRTPQKEVKRSPAPSPWSIKHEPTPKPRHELETTHQKNKPTSSHKTKEQQQHKESQSPRSPPKEVIKEAKPSPVPSPRSSKHEPPKPRQELETTHQKNKTSLVQGPNKEQQQQQHDPPSPRSPLKEVKEAKPSPVQSSRFIKHDPKPRHEHKTSTHHEHILKPSDKNGPNKKQQQDSNMSSSEADDFILSPQGVITISAENKGAVMEIQRSSSKTRGAEKEKEASKSKPNKYSNEYLPMNGFVNSNVQMINGSVVYNSMDTHHDPGVHLSLYRKPLGFIIKDHGNGYTSSVN